MHTSLSQSVTCHFPSFFGNSSVDIFLFRCTLRYFKWCLLIKFFTTCFFTTASCTSWAWWKFQAFDQSHLKSTRWPFPWEAMKTCSNSEWRLMYLQAGRILKRFVSALTAAFFIASCCFIHLHIFGSSSLKLEHFSTSLAGVIPPSRSRITCALNLAGYERHLFFKWRYLFFLTPAFYFPEVSDENVSIDGPSNSSALVTLTATVLEDSWPGWLITTLCLHFICVDKAPTFPDLSLQNLQEFALAMKATKHLWN